MFAWKETLLGDRMRQPLYDFCAVALWFTFFSSQRNQLTNSSLKMSYAYTLCPLMLQFDMLVD